MLWCMAVSATVVSARAGLTVPAGSPLAAFNVMLTVAPEVSGAARRALLAEAEGIWRHEGVTLRWLSGGEEADGAPALRVLIIPRLAANSGSTAERWAAGELVRFEGSGAIAIASISGAQRILDEARRKDLGTTSLSSVADERRLGVVLGRTVAHEIGHYLLHTNTHAERGLMRAAFDAREFTDLRTGSFRLDDKAGQWIRQRLLQTTSWSALIDALVAHAPSSAERQPGAGGFSYARP